MPRRLLRAGVLAGVLTGIVDGMFATVLSVFFYDSTFARLWTSVASVLFGKNATVAAGLLMHFGVAFFWSAIFLLLWARSHALQRVTSTMGGVLMVAAVYGPLIWMVMSLLVIPTLMHRPPNVTARWWIQCIGHFPFVGLPIVASVSKRR
ncbi:MAG TPA: hypothetical protein VHW00_04660 [Thermoanaerobaculia bacterium]|nr:hypothetical protein [Thermoanaerobaculia bacterium]